MINRLSLLYVLLWCFLSQGVFAAVRFSQEPFNMEELEHYLKTAKVVSIEVKESEGRTAPWEVTLDDGTTQRRARFKYVQRSRPNYLPDSYHYEIAAYKLAKLLGIQTIPPVVEREIDNTRGSLQMFVEGCFHLSDQKMRNLNPSDHKKIDNAIKELSVLENLTYCVRNERDILIKEKTWHVCRVDFSEAFAPEGNLISDSEITRCSRTLYKGLLDLESNTVRSKLSPYLNEDEIKALLKRKDLVLEKLSELIAKKGEEEVLF